jgi:protein-tyrosine phosphatase
MNKDKLKILMVCLGNICRSPTAEGVFRHQVRQRQIEHLFDIDSAGTGTWHIGESPDHRACSAAAKRNIDLSNLKARTVSPDDFHEYDYIFAMDSKNLSDLLTIQPESAKAQVMLFLTWPDLDNGRQGYREVPDPYYSSQEDFELVLDLVEQASQEILDHLVSVYQLN